MKTALTQLIEKWESEMGSYIPNAPIYAAFIAEAKELLESEKEQITEAYHKGQVAIFDIIKAKFPQHKFEATQHEVDLVESGKEKNEDAEDYYQQTYNQEQ